jgi:hypothetical protein
MKLIPEPDGAKFVQPTDGARQAYKKWAESKAPANDGILSSPLLGLAALLYLLGKFHDTERVGPESYDLLNYQPKRRTW